jgi:hypothetical protein
MPALSTCGQCARLVRTSLLDMMPPTPSAYAATYLNVASTLACNARRIDS